MRRRFRKEQVVSLFCVRNIGKGVGLALGLCVGLPVFLFIPRVRTTQLILLWNSVKLLLRPSSESLVFLRCLAWIVDNSFQGREEEGTRCFPGAGFETAAGRNRESRRSIGDLLVH